MRKPPKSKEIGKIREYKKTKEIKETETKEEINNENEFLAIGRKAVLEILNNDGAIDKLFIKKGEKEGAIRVIVAKAKEKGIVILEVPREKLDILSNNGKHQGVIAQTPAYEYSSVEEILRRTGKGNGAPFILICDKIFDPYNLGAMIRTAEACGIHGVIIPKRRSCGITPTVVKASAGAIEHVPVARVSNIAQTIEILKNRNIWVCGLDTDGISIFSEKLNLDGAIALVIGNEGAGVSHLVKERCDFSVSIPMLGAITSLNASVAAAVAMYEIVRRKH
ncbi:MAG: 23S rRNA (guanosine(2251)-2'-O)-methyltransferase RlmB [Defluviitaleaceae bacterium]|nr:23S rRNA (guanosine(2251)-2'-O)-methyltransferase RlmB [Defluviitaleaceae bacterium]